jgi:hypothetical protein
MRSWGIPPELLCRPHLLGEHRELHMMLGSISRGRSLWGLIEGGLIEVHSIVPRHEQIVTEMYRRGYTHNTPVPQISLPVFGYIDWLNSMHVLMMRCIECTHRMHDALDEDTIRMAMEYPLSDYEMARLEFRRKNPRHG